ncbi:MAG: hypothetical protein Q8R44_13985 [Novosphingobium sp.]|nr:hypothetical protein [Novosphingobium sp.]
MGLTFLCLAIAIHGDTLRCANNPGGNDVVQLAEIEVSEPVGGAAVTSVQLKHLVPGRVTCRQVDANPRAAGFQGLTAEGRMVARCSTQGHDLSAMLLAERGPQLRDKPRTRGLWSRRVEMTKAWLIAAK